MPGKKSEIKAVKKEFQVPLWFEEKDKIDPETWKILSERSEELAKEKFLIFREESGREYLGFLWGQTKCYLAVESVIEIKEFEYLEPVPSTPDILVGLANLRGEVVPVFDLRKFWSIPKEEVTETSKLIIMDEGLKKFGFWVDEVIGTFIEKEEDITPSHQYSGQLNNEYTLGVLPKGEDLWMVLNPEAILESSALFFDD